MFFLLFISVNESNDITIKCNFNVITIYGCMNDVRVNRM